MKSEYDFSNGIRGKFYQPNTKFRIPIYLDKDLVDYFTQQAEEKGVDVNKMINDLLRRNLTI